MRIKVVACKVMLRQLYRLAADSKNIVDIHWMRQALHNEPAQMRSWLSRKIDDIEREDDPFDAICLAYGLCSNGIVGLEPTRVPIIIPRAHDCITLLLGSCERYERLFNEGNGGIYWFSQGWIEHGNMPGRERYEAAYKQYEKYGEDNARYLIEMEQGWMREYKKAVYIRWPYENGNGESFTKGSAEFLGWKYEVEEGNPRLLRDLLDGNWDEERFLTVQPGSRVETAFDGGIIRAASTVFTP